MAKKKNEEPSVDGMTETAEELREALLATNEGSGGLGLVSFDKSMLLSSGYGSGL